MRRKIGWAFRAVAMVDGERRYGPARPTKAEAAHDYADMAGKRRSPHVRGKAPGLFEACDLVIEKLDLDGRAEATRADYVSTFRVLCREFGDVRLDRVTPETIEAFMRKRQRKVGAQRLRHDLVKLRRVFNVARKKRRIGPEIDPMAFIDMPRVPTSERAFFLPQEQAEVVAILGEDDRVPVDFLAQLAVLALTGMRRRSLCRLAKDSIDHDRGLLRIVSKGHGDGVEEILHPITPVLDAALGCLAVHPTGAFVGGATEQARVENIKNRFSRARRHLPDHLARKFRSHEWGRHSLVTAMRVRDVDEKLRRFIVGHKVDKRDSHARYDHATLMMARNVLHRILPELSHVLPRGAAWAASPPPKLREMGGSSS